VTEPDLELGEGETLMADPTELSYRQITAYLLDPSGAIATHAYTGEKSSGGRPSYSASSKVSAQDSRDWHTRNAGLNGRATSLAVRAISVEEVVAAKRWVVDDSAAPLGQDEVRAPGHCYVNAVGLDRLALKSLRAALWKAADDRGEIATNETLEDGEIDLSAVADEAQEEAI
jgi:hypothetical protein